MHSSNPAGVTFIPGTVRLIDDASRQTEETAAERQGQAGIILIPPPSEDPNDPLNWSPRRKRLQLALLCLYTFFMNGLVNFYGVAYDGLAPDLHTTINGLNTGSAILFLFSGVGAVCWPPVAMKMGRRPVYLLGLGIALVGSVLGALQTSWAEWVTFNVFWGIGCGPKEGLPQISLQDIYFVHEMGAKVGYWALSYSAGAFLVPLVAGYVYVGLSWRWCFWLTAIGFSTMAILLFFGLEETLYQRSHQSPNPATTICPTSEPNLTEEAVTTKSVRSVSGSDGASIRMKSYWQTHPLYTRTPNPNTTWAPLFRRPLQLLQFPPILWSGMFTGVSVCWWAAIFTTQSQFFTGPPYHWDGTQVGLSNSAALIGSLLGTVFAGNASDRFVIAVAKRNHGIREPEHRLVLLVITALVTSGGLVLYGKGVEVGLFWVAPVIGMGLMAFGFTASSIIGETYVLDSYRAVAAESLVVINAFRNLIGMTFVFCIQPWLNHSGYGAAYLQMMGMGLIMHLTVVPMVIWGKRLRGWTAQRYLDMVDQAGIPRECA